MYNTGNHWLLNNFRVGNLEGVAHTRNPQSISIKKLGPNF